MTWVNILCEDRTGNGLARVIESAVQARRANDKKPSLQIRSGTVAGNTQLLMQCEKYEFLRYRSRPRHDHIFYVIDAYRIWDLKPAIIEPPPPNQKDDGAYLERLTAAVCTAMTQRARGTRSENEWQSIADGFHPHVLVWERETLMLPVSDALGLGEPPRDPRAERHPARWVKQRFQGRSYQKAIHGPQLLERIASSPDLRGRVLDATPSLAAIVDELVSL